MEPEELTIGDLARRSGLTPKALRLYDQCDLLPPQRVDPFTGYRFYGRGQVERARFIARLRSIGMGLERIRIVCDLPPEAAAREVHAWWLQEQADARTRADEVASLLAVLRQYPTTEEDSMTTTTHHKAPSCAGRTERGPVRTRQQDAHRIRDLGDGATLLAVADGFGKDDEFAARVLDTLADALALASAAGSGDPLAALERAWGRVLALLPASDASDAGPAGAGAAGPDEGAAGSDAGAAVTAAVLHHDRLAIAHLGDVRLLLVREGVIDPVTRDHTYVASQVAAGRLTPDEAASHPQRATLNRALAAGAPTAPDLIVRHVRSGDRIVLLSDGVYAVVDPAALGDALTGSGRAAEVVDVVAGLAVEAGAPDNLSVLIADVP